MHKDTLHPTARVLIDPSSNLHDQKNWVITEDGLICAPIGFYRFLEQYNSETRKTAKTAAFAFNAEDLDLIPHPDDPTQKILKKPAYILEPLSETDALGHGLLERRMKDHQYEWLKFVLGYGNLYYTNRREEKQGEYFSNNFIAYRIFPVLDDDGTVIKYNVSYRTNPYSDDVDFGQK